MGWLSVFRQCVRKLGKKFELKDITPFTVKIFSWHRFWAVFLIFLILFFSSLCFMGFLLLWSQLVYVFGKCKDLFVYGGHKQQQYSVFVSKNMVRNFVITFLSSSDYSSLSLSHALVNLKISCMVAVTFLKSVLPLSLSPCFGNLSSSYLSVHQSPFDTSLIVRASVLASSWTKKRLLYKNFNSPNYRFY